MSSDAERHGSLAGEATQGAAGIGRDIEVPRQRPPRGAAAPGGTTSNRESPAPRTGSQDGSGAPSLLTESQASALPDYTMRRGVCLVIAAPSGAGKSSIARALLDSEPALTLSVSATTRPPRPGEVDGDHYFFRDDAAFLAMVAAGEMLEHAEIYGRRYGTPRAPVEQALAAGHDVLFDIDWQGHRQLRAALPGDVVGLFLLPPSLAELERRLAERGQDSAEEVARRMAGAREEISHWSEFDHVLVNADFMTTRDAARAVLHAARSVPGRCPGIAVLADTLIR
jgi:guanylate kinase